MAMDPRWTVHTSTQLWGEQVAILEDLDGKSTLRAELDKRQPVIYEFNGGKNCFRAPLNPYG